MLKAEGLKKQNSQYTELDNLPAISIADNMDDEAVYGKYTVNEKKSQDLIRDNSTRNIETKRPS